ncbi:zinc finger domain-containing protein [Actinoallomurus acanthiterrae]
MTVPPSGRPPRDQTGTGKPKAPKAQTISCPTCQAPAGRPCVGIKGQDLPKVHPRRRLAAGPAIAPGSLADPRD